MMRKRGNIASRGHRCYWRSGASITEVAAEDIQALWMHFSAVTYFARQFAREVIEHYTLYVFSYMHIKWNVVCDVVSLFQ